MIKVGVIGAGGRMGRTVCEAVDSTDDLELVARIEKGDSLDDLKSSGAEVAVEFTRPDAVKDNIRWCLEHGIHTVVGTSGLKAEDFAAIESWTSGSANVFIGPNFALGAVLMMRFAALAAPHFSSAEIVERHHEGKVDAPSGTSSRTAELMNEARSEPWIGPVSPAAPPGARGTAIDGIAIHSLRLPGSVAHQEVILGAPGETLTIRHDSLDRSSFMPGVLLAVRRVAGLPGLTIGLEKLLEL